MSDHLVTQTTAAPTRKIAGVIGAGLTTTILVAGLAFGVEVPEEVVNETVAGVVAAVNLVAILVGYFTRERVSSDVETVGESGHADTGQVLWILLVLVVVVVLLRVLGVI